MVKTPTKDDARAWVASLPADVAERLVGDGLCAMTGCSRTMTSIIRFDSTDSKMFAIRACDEHYEYLIEEMSNKLGIRYFAESRPDGRKDTKDQ